MRPFSFRNPGFVGVLSGGAVAYPTGFTWPASAPRPVITRSHSVFYSSIGAADFDVARALVLYVDASKSDDTGDGLTPATAKKTISGATSAVGAAASYELNIAAGVYVGTGSAITKPVTYRCPSGRAILTLSGKGGGEAVLDTGATYVWSSFVAGVVIDYADLDGDDLPTSLTVAADLAACRSTPGTWVVDSGNTYIHLHDGRVPDNDVAASATGGSFGLFRPNGVGCFAENIAILTGTTGRAVQCQRTAAVADAARYAFKNCDFIGYQSTTDVNQFLQDTGFAVLESCKTFGAVAGNDGNNYHQASTLIDFSFMEINCISMNNGNALADNQSTCHDGIHGIRINGVYTGNSAGRNVHDIGDASGNGGSWNLGCRTNGGAIGFVSGSTGTDFKMWLDGCTPGTHATAHLSVNSAGSHLYYRRMDLTGLTLVGTPEAY